MARRVSIEKRFWGKVLPPADPEDCLVWQGARTSHGYGYLAVRDEGSTKERKRLAHRLGYLMLEGSIPEGLELDHLCRNRACVNPNHLEPVTHRENVRRGIGRSVQNAAKTHCDRGHEFTEANTVVDSRGARECLACRPLKQQRRREREDRGVANGGKTHCPQGHEYTEENTVRWSHGRKGAGRECRACRHERELRKRKTDRGPHAERTECPAGHPYDAGNTYISPTGRRGCRACRKEAVRRSAAKKRAQVRDDAA